VTSQQNRRRKGVHVEEQAYKLGCSQPAEKKPLSIIPLSDIALMAKNRQQKEMIVFTGDSCITASSG
jgi:hypothetical protein